MADSALIDDLEKQFAENPRRVFARLANEYRKAGDAERAIEICRHHVPQQPGYISGHIVLGQALFDTAQFDEARSSFETALGLDPENLIALRQLGDIARETGDAEGARSWYRRLLEVDPQNDEVAEQLQALDVTADAAPAPDAVDGAEQEQVRWGDIYPEGVAAEPEPAAAEAAGGDDTPIPALPATAEAGDAPAAEAAEPEVPASPAPAAAAGGEPPELPEPEIVLDMSALEAPPAPPVTDEPDAAAAPAAGAGEWEAPELARVEPDQGSVAWEAQAAAPTPAQAPAGSGMEAQEETPADAFVTETMAELYCQQGFVDKALDIYRELARQSPDVTRFRERVEELEHAVLAAGSATGGGAAEQSSAAAWEPAAPVGPTIRTFLSVIASRRARVKASEPASDGGWGGGAQPGPARVNGTSSLETSSAWARPDAELFPGQSVAPRDDEAATALAGGYADAIGLDENGAGAPAHPAPDEISLDAVFRDVPTDRDPGARGHAVSFDEFFASDAQAGSGDAQPDADTAAPASDAGSSSDLELFHAWLEGLKK